MPIVSSFNLPQHCQCLGPVQIQLPALDPLVNEFPLDPYILFLTHLAWGGGDWPLTDTGLLTCLLQIP